MNRACLFISVGVLSLLPSCIDITQVQKGYVADRDECRGQAENKMGMYTQPESYPINNKERNNALLFLFCECMKEHDWNVVGCKTAKAPAVAAAAPAVPAAPYTPPPGFALVPVQVPSAP